MSPRRRKAEDADVFAAMVRVMMRVGPADLTLGAIAREAGVTAGALVQRFGSKRALMLAHARDAASSHDLGVEVPRPRTGSALRALRASADTYAALAPSPAAAVRNLAYLQNDLSDPVLRRNLLRLHRAARAHYEELAARAVEAGELRQGTDVKRLARTIEHTLVGSFLTWAIYREGSAAAWLRGDIEAVLRPHLAAGRRPAGATP